MKKEGKNKEKKEKVVSKETPGYFEEIRSRKENRKKNQLTSEDLANIDGE